MNCTKTLIKELLKNKFLTLKQVKEVRPFIIHPFKEVEQVVCNLGEELDPLVSAPFSIFSLEAINNSIVKWEFGNAVIGINSVICTETSPGEFEFYSLNNNFNKETGVYVKSINVYRESDIHEKVGKNKIVYLGTQYKDHLAGAIEKILKIINDSKSHQWGSDPLKRSTSIVSSRNGAIILHTPIHISSRENIRSNMECTRNIDWSHRWEVRGHWRKCATIGKDREGKYGVKGFTWVSSHERGPEDAPLIKKTRIIHA